MAQLYFFPREWPSARAGPTAPGVPNAPTARRRRTGENGAIAKAKLILDHTRFIDFFSFELWHYAARAEHRVGVAISPGDASRLGVGCRNPSPTRLKSS